MKSNNQRWLFFHGGPGLHSEAERRYWQPALRQAGVQVDFWDEPRGNGDPTQAFELLLQSAAQALSRSVAANNHQPVGLIGHSFGANTALELAKRFPLLVSKLVLLAPGTQIHTAFLRVIRIGHESALQAGADDAAKQIEDLLVQTREYPDAALLQGFSVALAQPGTILRYWYDLAHLQRWSQVMQSQEWLPDSQSQMGVILSSAKYFNSPQYGSLNLPTWLGFGAEDEIISRSEETRYLTQRLPVVAQKTFDATAHFIQLEAPIAVSNWLREIQEFDLPKTPLQHKSVDETRGKTQHEHIER